MWSERWLTLQIKYVPSAGKCCRVVSGLCPGPADYKMAFCD